MDRTLDSTTTTVGSDSYSPKDRGILVAVRIRPLSSKEVDSGAQVCCEILDGSNIVTISQAGVAGSYLKSQAGTINDYAFDVVFDSSASQMDVYKNTAKPFVQKVLAGLNVTVFAYGATSAGKTHTMFGSARADEAATHAEAGIIPNAIADVFNSISAKSESLAIGEKWAMNLSYIEVYNEQIFDLLVPVPTGKNLSLREDQEKGIVQVAGVIEQKVDTLDDVLKLLALGNRNRKTEATMANQVSSRSHAILQLNVIHTKGAKDCTVESKLSLIDLAGSERASATNNKGVRLMEGANINKSLLALANCINALAENSITGKKLNVKYRDSKLTLLLKNSLEGQSNLVIIANINPSHVTLEDSHNTLKYANRAKNIKVNPLSKEIMRDLSWAEREVRLKEENSALRKRVLYLEKVVGDLRGSLEALEGGSALPSDRGRGRSESSESIQISESSLFLEDDIPDRMSGSFSSSISSYSDMNVLDIADDYEAARRTALATTSIDSDTPISDELVDSLSLDESDGDGDVDSPEGEVRSKDTLKSILASSSINIKSETAVETEIKGELAVEVGSALIPTGPSTSSSTSSSSSLSSSCGESSTSPLEPCWQNVQSTVFMSPSLKRARCQAFEEEVEVEVIEKKKQEGVEEEEIQSVESTVLPASSTASVRSLRCSSRGQGGKVEATIDKQEQGEVQGGKEVDDEAQAHADCMIMKKRRMSAIPTLGRGIRRQSSLCTKKIQGAVGVAVTAAVGRRSLVAGRRSMLKRECATDSDRPVKRENLADIDIVTKDTLSDIDIDGDVIEGEADMDVWSKVDIENLVRRVSGSGTSTGDNSRRNSSSKRDSSSSKDVESVMKKESVTDTVEGLGRRKSWSKKDVESMVLKEDVTETETVPLSRRDESSTMNSMSKRDTSAVAETFHVNMSRRDSLGKRESLRLSTESLLAPLMLQYESSLRDISHTASPKGDAAHVSAFIADEEQDSSASGTSTISPPSSSGSASGSGITADATGDVSACGSASLTAIASGGFSTGTAPTYRARRTQSMGGRSRSREIEVRTVRYDTVECSAVHSSSCLQCSLRLRACSMFAYI